MSAFNARLRPKEIFGLPLYAVGAAAMMLPAWVMAVLIPVLGLKILFGLMGAVLLVLSIFMLTVGHDLPFLRMNWLSRIENHAVTAETWTQE